MFSKLTVIGLKQKEFKRGLRTDNYILEEKEMEIATCFPSPNLAPYIERFLILKSEQASSKVFKMVPRGFSAFLFTSPEMTIVGNKLGGVSVDLKPGHIYYGGLGIKPAEMTFNGKAHFIVGLLHPYLTGVFFNEDAKSFCENCRCITDLNAETRSFASLLWEANADFEKIKLIEHFLLKNLKRAVSNPYVEQAIKYIHQERGCVTSSELAKRVYTCERNLRRNFDQFVGVSPKQYADMFRFNSFMREFYAGTSSHLETLAFHYNYYDLSHLNKDFNRFLGICPSLNFLQDRTVNISILG